jgi:choline dehydrogenase
VEVADGRAMLDLDVTDDVAVDAYVRAEHRAFLHGCGTCAMGDVVDEELRVGGVDGLRVCDTSVLPEVPRANPNLTILAVADRAAALMSRS